MKEVPRRVKRGMVVVANGKCLAILFFGLAFFWLFAAAGHADSILAKANGNEVKLVGKVIELKKGAISILGEDGNITEVNWGNVNSISIDDQVFVLLNTDERILGFLRLENGQVVINSVAMGVIKSEPQKIVAIERRKREVPPALALSTQEMAAIRGRGNQASPPGEEKKKEVEKEKEKTTGPGKKTTTIGEKSEKRPEETFVRSEKVVLPKGKMDTEVTVSYYDNSHLGLSGTRDRTLVFPLTVRYGFTNRLLGVVTVPLAVGWREIPGDTKTRTNETSGLGDVSFGIQYQILTERVVRPDLMFYLMASSDTGKGGFLLPSTQTPLGTGFWQINPGLSFVKTVDPVVLFGSLSYTHFFEKSGFQPGEAINPLIGTGFAVNDEVAISFKLAGSFLTRPKFRGSEFGSVLSPFSFYFTVDKYVTNNSYLEPSVGIGLTSDAPDFSFALTYVYRWF